MITTFEEISNRIRNIKSIATLPHVMTRIMAVVADGRSSAKDLANEVRIDQALTSKILKVANSAYYGFYRKITNIEDAVVVLGFKEIRSLALAITVFGIFDETVNPFFDRKKFWRHCVITAVLAEMLAEPYSEESVQAFTSGLLHDLGRAVLDQFFPQEWKVICDEVQRRKVHWCEVEQELMGATHAEIGYQLGERWSFPPSLTDSIRYHHEPMRAETAPRLTAIVHLADLLSRRDKEQDEQYAVVPPLDQRVYQHVPLSRDRVEAIVQKYGKRRAGIEALVSQIVPA